jgi:hypothetical protein
MMTTHPEKTEFAKSLMECQGVELTWTRPHLLKRDYELRDEDTLVATLRFHSMFGSLATAQCAAGSWTFKRRGFLRTEVTVRRLDDPARDIAVFKNNTLTSGGTLELPDGRHMRASTNCWQSRYAIESGTGEVLLRYRGLGGLPFVKTRVEIEPAGAALSEIAWLVPLGFYLARMMESDSAAIAGAGGGAGG